ELAAYGNLAPATLGVIQRAVITLEQQCAGAFFGEPEFDVEDLLRLDASGAGVIHLLELSDVMDKPDLFSTFMLWLLAQLYSTLPEVGDQPKPKLAFFFDEAHLLFDRASDALLEQLELVARLIRSKGVGIYLVTQSPTDVAPKVLAQLGNRVQHALRAFTAQDADNLKNAVRTFPVTKDYDVEQSLQGLGIGEAMVTVLSPRGVPTPLAWTVLIPPDSLMAAMDPAALQQVLAGSPLTAKYAQAVGRESAREMITARIQAAQAAAASASGGTAPAHPAPPARTETPAKPHGGQAGGVDVGDLVKAGERFAASRQGQAIVRNVLGTLFGKKR